MIGHPVTPFKSPVKVKSNSSVEVIAKTMSVSLESKMLEKARSHELSLHSTISVSNWLQRNVLGVGVALSVA